jgi:hypothetical protein
MHLLPYPLRRLLHRPKRARQTSSEPFTVSDQREHDLRRYRPRPSASAPSSAEEELD